MNLNLLLSALRARSRVFFLILATTVLAALIVSLVMPKTYVAKVALLVDGKDDQSMRLNYAPRESERPGYVQTQVDILTSSRVAHRVVADLRLAEDAKAREEFASSGASGTIDDWLAEALLKSIKVETSQTGISQQSSLIQLSAFADDARFAARLANTYAKAYVATVLDVRVEPTRQTAAWFDDQLKGLRNNLDEAEKRLTDFQLEQGILTTDENFDIENTRLKDLAGLIVATPDAGVKPQAGRGGKSLLETAATAQSNRDIENVKSELLRSEAKLQQMATELGSMHPQYVRQQAEVRLLRDKVGEEIKAAIAMAEQSAQRSRQNKDRLISELGTQRERVLKLKQARNQMALLSHDVDIAQRTYENAMQRALASKIESRAQQSNVSVLDEAVPPSSPSRPKLLLNIALAFVIGGLLGLATVHLLETSDRRVRRVDDLALDTEVPLLAVLNTWDQATERRLGAPTFRYALPNLG